MAMIHLPSNCSWHQTTPLLKAYHDHEWGFATHCPQLLFEKLCLECLQAGLSWRTILEKRAAIRQAFTQFDIHSIAQFNAQNLQDCMQNPAIIRNSRKLQAIIHNARIALKIIEKHQSFSAFIWQFQPQGLTQPLSKPPQEAQQLVLALKQYGWQWIGETTAYAFMQAAGLINDHDLNCPIRDLAEKTQAIIK